MYQVYNFVRLGYGSERQKRRNPPGGTMETTLDMTPAGKDRPFADLGAMVQRYREAKGLSQEELANYLPVTKDQVRKIEQGLSRASFEVADAMDAALDTGGAIARAYWPSPASDEVATLRAEIARIAAHLQQLQALFDEFVLGGRAPPPDDSSR